MAAAIIVILGEHLLVRKILTDLLKTQPKYSYYKAPFDYSTYLATEEEAKELIQYEKGIDSSIKNDLHDKSYVFIEQWHIGSLACLQPPTKELTDDYFEYFEGILSEMKSVPIRWFYVSVDLESYPDDIRQRYHVVLHNLTKFIRTLDLTTENIDGEAPEENVEIRLAYLINQGIP